MRRRLSPPIETAQEPSLPAAAELSLPVIHLSTDYVFDGDKPESYVESDPVGPVSVYGRSKLEGEYAVAAANENQVILRTAWVYSTFGHNFVKTMLRLAETREELSVVSDQLGCPTSTNDIAEAIVKIAARLSSDSSLDLRGFFIWPAAAKRAGPGLHDIYRQFSRKRPAGASSSGTLRPPTTPQPRNGPLIPDCAAIS